MDITKDMRQLKAIQDRIKNLQQQEKSMKSSMQDTLSKMGTDSYCANYESEGIKLTLNKCKREKYTFDIDKLKEVCAKKTGNEKAMNHLFSSCVDKHFVVDEAALRQLLKKYPKLRKPFKKVIQAKSVVNEDKLIQTIGNGDLSYLDVQKFSSVKVTEYVELRTKELEGD